MAEIKTKPTAMAVDDFIAAVPHPVRRADGAALVAMFARITAAPATMWGPTIIGFGSYHYRYASGHQGDMCRTGFSPRAANLALYVGGFPEYDVLLDRLGKHKRAKACLYINTLADIDADVLQAIIRGSWDATQHSDHCPTC